MKIMGLDVGTRRIGVAVCDGEELLAVPYATIQQGEDAQSSIEKICEIIKQEGIEQVVVGIPFSLNGTLGPQGQDTSDFVEMLDAKAGVPIIRVDERLTTVQAERMLRSAGYSGPALRERLDAAAAVIILDGHLDRRKREAGS